MKYKSKHHEFNKARKNQQYQYVYDIISLMSLMIYIGTYRVRFRDFLASLWHKPLTVESSRLWNGRGSLSASFYSDPPPPSPDSPPPYTPNRSSHGSHGGNGILCSREAKWNVCASFHLCRSPALRLSFAMVPEDAQGQI